MIGRICGKLVEAGFNELLVDVNGVGYLIFIPMSTYDTLPPEGKEVTLMTYLHVKEDTLDLYGFATKEEKALFLLLRTVSGIGPKVAMNILSSMSVGTFCDAVARGDIKMLTTLKGLGKKSAERLVLELKNKVSDVSASAASASVSVSDEVAQSIKEATLALVQLGFKYEDAARSVHAVAKELPDSECSSENLIKQAMSLHNS